MKKNNIIFCITCVFITTIMSIALLVVGLCFKDKSNSILSDRVSFAMYVDNNEVTSLNEVPSGYVIDKSRSYCWKTNRNTHDTSAVINAGENGEPVIGNLINNEKCIFYYKDGSFSNWLINEAPRSGTDAVSNSPWKLVSDRTGEWRYVGTNPDNYVQFNGELWRIIGVMPNTVYCTGTYGNSNECNSTATGSLVKIMRNDSLGTFRFDYKNAGVGSSNAAAGSNDWTDSQLMLMLNGTTYLKTGYDVNGTKLHTSYTIASNVVKGNGYNFYNAKYSYLDGSGTTVYIPSQATTSSYTATSGTVAKKIESSALDRIATVKWHLYGVPYDRTDGGGSALVLYNAERNINGTGLVHTDASLPENRSVYWYGKIGLIYPSDYGYATNGNNAASGTYSRNDCITHSITSWLPGDNNYDVCSTYDWISFVGITSSAPTTGSLQWMISPNINTVNQFLVRPTYCGRGNPNSTSIAVRPAVYLKTNTVFVGRGTGKWNDPYIIK